MPSLRFVVLIASAVGCGPLLPGEDLVSGDGSDSDGDDALTHGRIKIELRRGESQNANPYADTTNITVTMVYRECLVGFYEENPDLRQDGVDGAAIFGDASLGGEGWIDRLCNTDEPMATAVSCTVVSIEQMLGDIPQLTVTYAVSEDVENRVLWFGPIPTKETAGCVAPIVRIATNGAIRGTNDAGNDVWVTESFSPTEALTDQGGPIIVRAARVE